MWGHQRWGLLGTSRLVATQNQPRQANPGWVGSSKVTLHSDPHLSGVLEPLALRPCCRPFLTDQHKSRIFTCVENLQISSLPEGNNAETALAPPSRVMIGLALTLRPCAHRPQVITPGRSMDSLRFAR